ncbi:MAG: hypothetical protein E7270_05070 [Lachnospiraceae bacterium]|nr:hypothetical protein [Lachnospiraceae bacterium]MBQ4069232.1 hypothetical protein [Lachnospiraceae bacterium]
MGNSYTIDSERQMIIYESNNNICLRTINSLSIGRPAILCNDYFASMSSTIVNNMLYYSYINIENDIVIKNVTDTTILYSLECKDCLTIQNPFIFNYNERLVLAYSVKTPLDTNYSVKIMYPFENEPVTEIDNIYTEAPLINYIVLRDSIIFVISSSNTHNIWCLNNDGILCELTSEKILTKKISSYYDEEIKNKELIISNIRTQYNELMTTAISYKNEAKKWHDKYFENSD